jgi:hypothetical protein
MTDNRPRKGDLSTEDLAAAAEQVAERRAVDVRRLGDREVAISRSRDETDADAEHTDTSLLDPEISRELRQRWSDVQAGFVDEPRQAVEKADALVAEAIKRLAESFATTRADLEQSWARGDNVSTEDLRLTLQRYRAFFGRLLHA